MPHRPVIAIPGQPDWAAALAPLQADAGFTLSYVPSRQGYIAHLVDVRAALILVDGAGGWDYWTAAPKSSPATRRIPVVLVSDDPAIRARALRSGADLALAPSELVARLPDLLREHGRVQPSDEAGQLAGQCADPLPDAARQAVDLFNRGEYYKQHDLFEALWVAEPGPVRDLYRAVLQVGVAYHQIVRGNRRGALKMLLRSVQWLNLLPDVCQGIDVARLREDAAQVRAALEAWPDERDLGEFDRSLLKPVVLVDSSQ